MNVFVFTMGHCGSRVVVEAFEMLGFVAPGVQDLRKNNAEMALMPSYTGSKEKLRTRKARKRLHKAIEGHDNAVFKALPLLQFWRELDGYFVGVYRHPTLWKQATKAKDKAHRWKHWIRFHEELLEAFDDQPFPLVNFSEDFVYDMTRHFGDCLGHFEDSRINQRDVKSDPPDDVVAIYEQLEARRCNLSSQNPPTLSSIPIRISS